MEQLWQTFLATFAVYGIAHLVVYEDGPADLFLKLRRMGSLFRCVPCFTVWIAIPFLFLTDIGILGYLATIGGVIVIDRNHL